MKDVDAKIVPTHFELDSGYPGLGYWGLKVYRTLSSLRIIIVVEYKRQEVVIACVLPTVLEKYHF